MPERVVCNLCGSAEQKIKPGLKYFLTLQDPYNIVMCPKCHLTYMSPRPTTVEYKNYYESQGDYDVSAYLNRVSKRLPGYEARMKEIQAFYHGTGKLLEIGCAAGHFLAIAQGLGWEVCGVEFSDLLAAYARTEFGLNVLTCATLSEAGLPEGEFDVVYSRHVLEHLPDPMSALVESFRVLKKGGLLFIEVPNQFDSFRARLKRLIMALSGRALEGIVFAKPLSAIHHTYFFNPDTLAAMVRQAGFTIRELTCSEQVHNNRDLWRYITQKISFLDKLGPNIMLWAIK